ncbi:MULTISPECIES: ATP synthase F0 subunit B [Acidobacterium]|uniref:F0F1 ATP synthase subunit B family protein n=1 Tax=Acidobacterium TaxID=33973 RepID=UPI0002F63971|nr:MULTISPECIES: ATP synthase F0 subunit B [Acidobacterium]HCT60264.1 hypothetical protein [Acidobacterium sp.]
MRRLQKTIFAMALAVCMGSFATPMARAATVTPAQAAGQQAIHNGPTTEKMDAPETDHQLDQYRHSPAVQKLANAMHLSVETTAQIFEDFNSGLLLVVIAYFLFKLLPGAFKNRSQRLAKDLVEAHSATEDANRRLEAIEARLSHLDADIASYRERSEQEAAEEEKRMRESLEAERKRIVSSAEREIEQAGAAAQRELTRYTAQLALAQARRELKVSAEMDQSLVADFGKSLAEERNGGRH